ncbi:MAG: methionine gamma-lyase family protein, partial [Cyanobacteria bacterium]|nr:methionine gamma-lyase family protein [Cyanobacteriota bacterium]
MTLSAEELIQSSEDRLLDTFREVDDIAFHNQRRLLEIFRENRVTEEFFNTRTGYAIDDAGRDTMDKLFAQLVGAEAACLRMQFVSGTHALACAILGNLRPGDKMVGLTGLPYDTLQPVVGITGNVPGSVSNIGADYSQIDMADALNDQGALEAMIDQVRPVRLYHIQKSRGYSMARRTYSNAEIKCMIDAVRSRDPGALVLVDNCYGEFVERDEPTAG